MQLFAIFFTELFNVIVKTFGDLNMSVQLLNPISTRNKFIQNLKANFFLASENQHVSVSAFSCGGIWDQDRFVR